MKVVQNTTPYEWTVQRVYDNFPMNAQEWESLGQQDSNIHWEYGKHADALIRNGVPNMIAYTAIGRKAGRTSQTIRKAYYTYKAFPDAIREQYHLVPYSVFKHARACEAPEEVLQYYVDEAGCSIDEVEAVFPLTETGDERSEFIKSEFPRYLYGAYRQMIGLNGKREQAEYHLREFVKIVESE